MPHIRADQRHIQQIILNLLSNAVKFTPEGGKILLHGMVNENSEVHITISDSGVGGSKRRY